MSQNKTKVAIFDFCGTCVNFQTADEYIRFATDGLVSEEKIKKSEKKRAFFEKTKISKVYSKLFNSYLGKQIIAKRIKGMSFEEANNKAEKYVEEKIKPNIIKETMEYFQKLKKEGVFTLFVSAAYDIYLSKFVKEFGFDDYISTKLVVKNNKMTGKIKKDCVGKVKPKVALKYLNERFGKDNYEIVFSISDSSSDIPILELANEKVVISKEHQPWVKGTYKEVIYGK